MQDQRGLSNPENKKNRSIYNIWCMMRYRCRNKDGKSYHLYGGRGIKICARWQVFVNFYEDMLPTHFIGATIDRIDNDEGYSPKNCRWIKKSEQGQNLRTNRRLTFNGKTQNLNQWGKELGLPHPILSDRLNKLGWDIERALTVPRKILHRKAME